MNRTAKKLVQDCCSTHAKSLLSLREKKVKTQALGETIPTWVRKPQKKLGYFYNKKIFQGLNQDL
jgi:hypothetical protein